MRLGVLGLGEIPFGVLDTEVLAPLRAFDIDVVSSETPDAPATTEPEASEQCQRLCRADCDGVLLFAGSHGASAAACATAAALHLPGVPLLLTGLPSPAFFQSAGVLAASGASFDRHFCPSDFVLSALPPVIQNWLRENRKQERQRGAEAARKLYGQRLYVPAEYPTPDPFRWMHQFGVVVTRDPSLADFAASEGDSEAALTVQVLKGIAGDAAVFQVPVWGERPNSPPNPEGIATFARITRTAGRYQCLITTGWIAAAAPKDGAAVHQYAHPGEALIALATFPDFHGVAGEHVGAVRAACLGLDVEPVILR